jgi:ADP-ribose pyrophosphatase
VYEVVSSRRVYEGKIITVRVDEVRMPGGETAEREVVEHDDAVAVVALDKGGRVLLIRQYRHPLTRKLWELPAGLCDVDGESFPDTARRELAEETGFEAGVWHTLADMHPSPGMSTEFTRVYLAREVRELPDKSERQDEEADLEPTWVPLDEAVARVEAGEITNGLAVVGLLAAARARDRGFEGLRPAG